MEGCALSTEKLQVPALQAPRRSSGRLRSNILATAPSMKRKITPDGPGLREFSAKPAAVAALGSLPGSGAAAVGRPGLSPPQDWSALSSVPQAAVKSASAGCGALHIWSAFVLLMTLMTVPLF